MNGQFGAMLLLTANLSDSPIAIQSNKTNGIQVWGEAIGDLLPRWSVSWRIGG